MKKSLTNLAVHTVDQLARTVKNWLKRMQYRPALISDAHLVNFAERSWCSDRADLGNHVARMYVM